MVLAHLSFPTMYHHSAFVQDCTPEFRTHLHKMILNIVAVTSVFRVEGTTVRSTTGTVLLGSRPKAL